MLRSNCMLQQQVCVSAASMRLQQRKYVTPAANARPSSKCALHWQLHAKVVGLMWLQAQHKLVHCRAMHHVLGPVALSCRPEAGSAGGVLRSNSSCVLR
jgi:hypothetical protein